MGVLDILSHNDLDSALKNRQLQVAFQPTISLSKLSALGAEAFLRWQHPALGLLPANLFMPFAREQGRTREVALFMLRETLRAVAQWRQSGLDWNAYVNIDGADLADGMLADSIALLLCEFEVPAEALTLDVREADLSERGAQILPHLAGLRAMGVGIALDTAPGEAPLQDISNLPLTEMKVAGPAIIRFIELTQETGLGRIMHRLQQAKAAGLRTAAVRVESEATLWALQRVGFDAAQGAYISPPVPLNELVRWDKIWRQAAEALSAQKRQQDSARPSHDAPLEAELEDRIEPAGASFAPQAEHVDSFDADFLSRALDVVAPREVEAEPQPIFEPAPIFSNPAPAPLQAPPAAARDDDFSFDAPVAQEPEAIEDFPEMDETPPEEDAHEATSSLDSPIGEFSFDSEIGNEDVEDALAVDSRYIDEETDEPETAQIAPEADDSAELSAPLDKPAMRPARSKPETPRQETFARDLARDVAAAEHTLPPNFTIYHKSASGAPLSDKSARSSPLHALIHRTKAKAGGGKSAPFEPVLIERRLPGLDKPITMQVASSAPEGKSLFGKMKPFARK